MFESNSFEGPDTLQVDIEVTSDATGADVVSGAPDVFRLGRPRPNPSSGAVELELALPAAGEATVDVFDVHGRRVATILSGARPEGVHSVRWDARDANGRRVGSGVYFVRALAGSERAMQRVIIRE